jgi:hypothetical protein
MGNTKGTKDTNGTKDVKGTNGGARMAAEEVLGEAYEEVTDAGVVLRERRVGYSTRGYDFDDATGAIIGCALEVHRTLGPGFREIVYQRALALELEAAGLEFEREVKVPIFYKGRQIDTRRVTALTMLNYPPPA